jgi:hypothetical protein
MLATMNVADKIAPLVALASELPAHVHDVRFDEGADGEMWVYVNAHSAPLERARFLCFVARSDESIASETEQLEAALAEWVASTKVAGLDFAKYEFSRLLVGIKSTAAAEAKVFAEQETERQGVLDVRRQRDLEIAASAGWEKKAARALRAGNEAGALEALAQKTARDELAAELKVQLDARVQAVWQASADKLAEVTSAMTAAALEQAEAAGLQRTAKLAAVPPARLTDRLAELREVVGKVAVHPSDSSSAGIFAAPNELRGIVSAEAEWMTTGVRV